MAEYRLAKVATELDLSFQLLADMLNKQGFDVMPKPTTKITEEMYHVLLREFSAEKAAKDEENLLKFNRENKPTPPHPVELIAKRITPISQLLVESEVKVPKLDPEKLATRLNDAHGPKVLGKIDIGVKKYKGDEEQKRQNANRKLAILENIIALVEYEENEQSFICGSNYFRFVAYNIELIQPSV